MKAMILAGGRGARLEGVTNDRNKCMHEFKGRPLIEYSLENAKNAGVDEMVIVVSYRAESIINHYGNRYDGRPIKYVIQWERKGLVHAMECCRDTVGDSDFMLFLADEVMVHPRHSAMVRDFRGDENVFGLCGVVKVDDREAIKKTYSLIYEESTGQIYRLVEKPKHPMNDLMGTGNCIFQNSIFDFIDDTPINQQRGEKEMPDLIQCAIDDGRMVKVFDIGDAYINVNTVGDMGLLQKEWEDYDQGMFLPSVQGGGAPP